MKTVLVDIDETICFYSKERDYKLAEPNYENISKINKLSEQGWKVIYWTARGSLSGIDYYELTLNQLIKWNCKFSELQVGPKYKPHFDLLIDDKSKRIEEI